MPDDDAKLIDQYISTNSGSAFDEIVRRHVGWVHASALRQTRDPAAAEDVTQAVFILLARKAPSLRGRASLGTWLFNATRYCVIAAERSRRRRAHHEQQAATMNPETARIEDPAGSVEWRELADRLDALVQRLGKADRQAILLRYFERRSLADIAAALGVSEEAAKKRVARAVERLRGFYAKEGVVLSVAAISAALEHGAAGAADATLAAKVSAAATNAAAASATSAGAIASGASGLMAGATMKFVAACAVACVVVGGAATTYVVTAKSGGSNQLTAAVARVTPATQPATAEPDRSTPANLFKRLDYASAKGDKAMILSCFRITDAADGALLDALANFIVESVRLNETAVAQFGPEAGRFGLPGPSAPSLLRDSSWKIEGDRASGKDAAFGGAVAYRDATGQWVIDARESIGANTPVAEVARMVNLRLAAIRTLTARIAAGDITDYATAERELIEVKERIPKRPPTTRK